MRGPSSSQGTLVPPASYTLTPGGTHKLDSYPKHHEHRAPQQSTKIHFFLQIAGYFVLRTGGLLSFLRDHAAILFETARCYIDIPLSLRASVASDLLMEGVPFMSSF